MNRLSSRQRKLVYLCGILILLIPIIWLGRPGAGEDQGGRLAQLRRSHDLGENQLGKVDPTSAAMNLVLLGLPRHCRGLDLAQRRPQRGNQELGRAAGRRRRDHHAAAPLRESLAIPRLEPGVQRLGRLGPGRGPLLLGERRGQVPQAGLRGERKSGAAPVRRGANRGHQDRACRRVAILSQVLQLQGSERRSLQGASRSGAESAVQGQLPGGQGSVPRRQRTRA